MRLFPVALASLAIVMCAALPASAAGKGKAKGKAPVSAPAAPVLDEKLSQLVVAKLASNDGGEVLEGLTAAAAGGPVAAPLAPAIEALLVRGTTLTLAKAAIETLGAIGAASSSAALRPYVRHRVPELRRAAARALGSTRGPEALAAFRDGLRSPDGQVRGFSATGLGNLWAADALPDLFLALDHNVTEAAASIGLLCTVETCEKFLTRLGALPLDVMTSGIDPIFFRPKPFPEEKLVDVVGRLRELGSPEAGKYLADVLGRWPAAGSKRVKQSLESAIASLPRGAK
jgi:HEAT repeat protein